eukprot:scaffold117469_cov75-Cyclotella_meneghiniana.AAC.7
MAIDPPADHYQQDKSTLSESITPHPFEIALIRKLEARTKKVSDAFRILDADGDGCISPSDMMTALHNEFGMDITQEQEQYIFSRFSNKGEGAVDSCAKTQVGMTFGEFAKYFNAVSSAACYMPSSESGSAAAVGFHIDQGRDADRELPILETIETKRLRLRHQLRQTLSAHSSRTHGGSGMKETSLYLAIDVHRSGKVTMQELLDWLKSVGIEWDMNQLKLVVLGCHSDEKGNELEKHFFGTDDDMLERGIEAGMTEHEFALFVESLDRDSSIDEARNKVKEAQDKRGVVAIN